LVSDNQAKINGSRMTYPRQSHPGHGWLWTVLTDLRRRHTVMASHSLPHVWRIMTL
jgi:hypothetical protein